MQTPGFPPTLEQLERFLNDHWGEAVHTQEPSITASQSAGIRFFIPVNTTSGVVTITLPPVEGNTGRLYCVKKTSADGNNVVVDGYGSETIDGAANITWSTQYRSYTIICDGAAWHIIGIYTP